MNSPSILISGANRGLGFGFAEAYAKQGFKVFATARTPEKSDELFRLRKQYDGQVFVCQMDVSSDDSVRKAYQTISSQTKQLDILINNAGVYGTRSGVDLAEIRNIFDINTLGPLRITQAFYPLLQKGSGKKLIHITSLMGSIEDNESGGSYAYRLSKAALNMLSKNLAHDGSKDGVISVAVHPGWVQTDMGGKSAPMSLQSSVEQMVSLIERLTSNQSGSFLRFDGKEMPY